MWQDFEGGVYWDKLTKTCSDILRAAGFQGMERFRGIRYVHLQIKATNIINQ